MFLGPNVDTSGPYPRVSSPLPLRVLKRFQQIAIDNGVYPQAGSVARFKLERSRAPQETPEYTDYLPEDASTTSIKTISEIEDYKDLSREELLRELGFDPETMARADWTYGPAIVRSTSGPRKSRRDPHRVDSLLGKLVADNGWNTNLKVASLIKNWAELVGDSIAAHAQVESFTDGKLVIRTTSHNWANQLKMLIPQLGKRLEKELGRGIVKSIVVLPPGGHTFKRGRLSVPGRGVRDTFD